MELHDVISSELRSSIAPLKELLADARSMGSLADVMGVVCSAVRNHSTIFFCGNGGSAADALHAAAEFTGRFRRERRPYPAIALGENLSAITAIANDYSYAEIFSRQLGAYGKEGDLLICFSTSGNSENVTRAAQLAKDMGITVIGLVGKNGGQLADAVDLVVRVPSTDTPHIQEGHMVIAHVMAEVAERMLIE